MDQAINLAIAAAKTDGVIAGVSGIGGARYRKKPVVVEAVQWFPDETLGIFEVFAGEIFYHNRRVGTDAYGVEYTICDVGLRTLEGFMHIKPGYWIITGVAGERYACEPAIFAATYEMA